MRRQLAHAGPTSVLFAREHLRAPLTLSMIVLLPPLFVIASASVLTPFAEALGGNVAGHQAAALGAGWAVAFMAGAVGYFQTSSSRDADRRLARAGMGALPTAVARLLSAVLISLVLTAVALIALRIKQPIPHLMHTALAMLAFAVVYLGIGTVVGVLISDELAGSLTVVFIFILDVFSGPGMAPPPSGIAKLLNPSRFAGELLLRAGAGVNSPTGDWQQGGLTVVISIGVALGVFWLAARRRT